VVLHTFCSMSQNVLVDAPTLAQSTIAQMAVQKMHVIVQKKQVAFVDNGPQHQTGRGADVGAAQTHKATQGSCHSMTTGGEYCDNPLRLANEIDAALAKHGLAKDRHLITSIKFFEGELRLIAECLRCVGPQKVAKQPRGNTDGMAPREEIEKYLKQLKQSHGPGNVVDLSRRRRERSFVS
jgi:hypothetical protein